MADEATIRTSLQVRVGNLNYQSQPTSFRADVSTAKGPTPGMISVPVTGVSVTFSQLVTPGLCWIQNLDDTNFVEYGIRDPASNKFYPLGELLAGECYPLRFSRNLLSDYYNAAGTGTDGDVNYLWFKANTAACNVVIHAFEK